LFKKKLISSVFLALGILAFDQFTKYLVLKGMRLYQSIHIIDHILSITYIRNPNSVFGISFGGKFPYPVMILILVVAVLILWTVENKPTFYLLYSAIIGGALGNLIDRLRFKEVIDFIDVGLGKNLRWPVFNVADASISISVVLLLYFSLKSARVKRDEITTD